MHASVSNRSPDRVRQSHKLEVTPEKAANLRERFSEAAED